MGEDLQDETSAVDVRAVLEELEGVSISVPDDLAQAEGDHAVVARALAPLIESLTIYHCGRD